MQHAFLTWASQYILLIFLSPVTFSLCLVFYIFFISPGLTLSYSFFLATIGQRVEQKWRAPACRSRARRGGEGGITSRQERCQCCKAGQRRQISVSNLTIVCKHNLTIRNCLSVPAGTTILKTWMMQKAMYYIVGKHPVCQIFTLSFQFKDYMCCNAAKAQVLT